MRGEVWWRRANNVVRIEYSLNEEYVGGWYTVEANSIVADYKYTHEDSLPYAQDIFAQFIDVCQNVGFL